ncbi:Survival motor neuron protein [Sergentomyia squamirostris]
MPKSAVYNKEEECNGAEDPWDDELLIQAYEESIRLSKLEVAKKIAAGTCKDTNDNTKTDDSAGRRSLLWQPVKYKVGDFVRAVYADDGTEYEATVVSTSGGTGKCLIKFIGYENEQYVSASELKDSHGGEARAEQIEASLRELCEDDDDASTTTDGQESTITGTSETYSIPGHTLPFLNPGSASSLFKPPSLPPFANDPSQDGKLLSAMLQAWYTSGYYTGLYEGQRMATKSHKKKKGKKIQS